MQDLTGKTIAGYQIVEQIGRGGMATVFRAYQPSLDRDVAVKVLPPYYAEQDETFLERFKREARAIAKLRHPNILMVMDFGQEDDLSFIVMEYVTAGTLKDRMKEPVQLSEIFELTKQIASALQYAHDQGVVHRDVKPSNIMMPKPDWALLTDFGLARMVGGSFLTQSGMTVGTPAYMSPEQGSGERVDHRSDIYSLGVMLYEMVVGEVPYTAETPMAVVVKHIVDPLPMPRAKNPTIPEELQKVILKALAKNPDDRYQSISEIPDALEKIAGSHPEWSAAEMKAVNAVREPHTDQPDTKVIEEESLEAGLAQDPTVGDLPGTKTGEPAETVPEATAPAQAPVQETTTQAAAESAAQVKQESSKKKRPLWPWLAGGFMVLAALAVAGFFALNFIFSDNNNVADNNPLPPVAEEPLPPQDAPEDIGNGDEQIPDEGEVQSVIDLLEAGDFERASQILGIAMRRNPQIWGILISRVEQLDSRGQPELAARLLAVGLDANHEAPVENYSWLGWLYFSAEIPNEAYDAFEEALRRQPDLADAHDGLINSAVVTDNIPRAIGFLEELQTKHPEVVHIYVSLGSLYRAAENDDQAIASYERALEIAPGDPRILIMAGEVFAYAGDQGRAMELLGRAMERMPEDPYLLGNAGYAYLFMEEYEQAFFVFEKALQLDKFDGWNALGLAQSILYTGRDVERIPNLLETAERMGKETQDAWLLTDLGWFYLDMGDCENAVRLFTGVEQFAPGETDAQEGISACE